MSASDVARAQRERLDGVYEAFRAAQTPDNGGTGYALRVRGPGGGHSKWLTITPYEFAAVRSALVAARLEETR